MIRAPSVLVLALLACSCARGDERAAQRSEADPAVVAALSDPLMTDPDLASQSRASAALGGGGGPASAEIPAVLRSADALEGARAAAAKLAGARLAAASDIPAGEPLPEAVTAPAFARLLPGAGPCADKAGFGFIWAAALPVAFPVFPMGHALVGAGNDLGGCRLRSVRFVTPVPAGEVAAFYLARGKAAALPLAPRQAGEAVVLAGARGNTAVLVRIAPRGDGLTEVELATSGL